MESGQANKARPRRKAEALEWLRSRHVRRVDESVAAEVLGAVEGLTAMALRAALLESEFELAPMVEGVRQDTFDDLERTLAALEREYESGDAARGKKARQLVITSRQHAEWAARNRRVSEAQRQVKAEMRLWIRTWLENPPLFASWVRLRKREACLPGQDAI